MNQVSRPMQIALAAALVFMALWFTVLRPKEPAIEPVAAAPVTTPAPAGSGSVAGALANDVKKAKSTAADASADAAKTSAQTGEASTTPATSPKGAATETSPNATTPVATTPAQRAAAAKDAVPAAQQRANKVIEKITKDLAARRAVVVLVWSAAGTEDRELKRRVTKEISRRGGKVRVYLIPVSGVGRYDGLLSGLAISQTPSTIVIAPDNQAKVLGGLTSTQRIDRLTSSALQISPAKTTP